MASWRYWRIYITANNGSSYTAIQEVELRGTTGGADITSSASPTDQSSSYNASNTAQRVVDNNTTDYINPWVSGVGASFPHWVKFDVATSQTVAEIAIWPQARSDLVNRSPKDFLIQGSDDNSTWATEASFTNVTGWVANTAKVFAVGAAAPTNTPINHGAGSVLVGGSIPTISRTNISGIYFGTGTILAEGISGLVVHSDNINIPFGVGTLELSGYTQAIFRTNNLHPLTGPFLVSGYSGSVSQSNNIKMEFFTEEFQVSGHTSFVETTENHKFIFEKGEILVSGLHPVIRITDNREILFASGEYSLEGLGQNVKIGDNVELNFSTGSVLVTPYDPDVLISNSSVFRTGRIEAYGHDPSIARTENSVLQFGNFEFQVNGYEGEIHRHLFITHETEEMSLGGFSNEIIQTNNVVLDFGLGIITTSNQIPSVVRTDHREIGLRPENIIVSGHEQSTGNVTGFYFNGGEFQVLGGVGTISQSENRIISFNHSNLFVIGGFPDVVISLPYEPYKTAFIYSNITQKPVLTLYSSINGEFVIPDSYDMTLHYLVIFGKNGKLFRYYTYDRLE